MKYGGMDYGLYGLMDYGVWTKTNVESDEPTALMTDINKDRQ